jgi:hypothetical protein
LVTWSILAVIDGYRDHTDCHRLAKVPTLPSRVPSSQGSAIALKKAWR